MCRSEAHSWDTQSDTAPPPPPELVAVLATWGLKQVLDDQEFWENLREVLSDPAYLG